MIQHLLVAFIAFVVAYSLAGTSIMIQGINGYYSYNLYESDRSRTYEDSYLFNNILGNNVSDVLRHVAIRSQLETNGRYDNKKKVDVTAYVNRSATLSGDYVTAVYYLSDLLKWAQSGFTYEKRKFTNSESADFLAETTTYTHQKNNAYSAGMNAYLNSQIEGNTLTFTVSGKAASPAGGEHTCLVNRYETVDGKNIEDIASSWEEYNLLCGYVEEAAKDLLANYDEYSKAVDYYEYTNSNLRYYITRSINGKTEVYTNVKELMGETVGKDIMTIFKDYGRYIYFCPYEIKYDTNTLIKENVVRNILKTYSYAYPDQMKIYIAVDTVGYGASDAFNEGKSCFTRYMPYQNQLYILCFSAAVLYLVLLVIYLRAIPTPYKEGLEKSAEKGSVVVEEKLTVDPQTSGKRSIYTEAVVLLGLIIMAIPVTAIYVLKLLQGSYGSLISDSFFPFYCAIAAFIMNIGLLFMIYGITKKAKGHVLWYDSFLRAIGLVSRNIIVSTTDNGNVIIRSWIPYVFFVVCNMLLWRLGLAGIVIAVCLDILVGVYLYRQNLDRDRIIGVIEKIQMGDVKAKADTTGLHSDNIKLADAVNSIGEGIDKAVNTSMKDEKLKADLITNVSHDIKTPLTSIINYVDLIKREDVDNERVKEYIDILEHKSQKLKQLTEDLLEASKISSGNISIELTKINFVELVNQTIGEFYNKFEDRDLQIIFKPQQQNMAIMADARHLWRVIENLLNNVCKYALPGTRVYLDMHYEGDTSDRMKTVFSIKNISQSELNIDATELTERFIRGDVSRTTEGSGLGLSIAKNLTVAQGGEFDIRLDGDLFKVIIKFDSAM